MSSLTSQMSSISCSSADVRLVLLGKTGSGKSASANTILGHEAFDAAAGASSVALCCRRACGEFRGRRLTLLEAPGLLHTHQPAEHVLKEMRRSVGLLSPGPSAFLLILRVGRFTREEKEAVRQLKQAMGAHVLSFSLVVFTHGDLLEDGASVKHCLIDDCGDLAELVAACGGRYCVLNNQAPNNREQVAELLALVDSMMQENEGSCYDVKMLQRAEENWVQEVEEERRRLKEKEELLKKVQQAAIKEWYEKELDVVQQKSKMEMEERMWALEKVNKLARDREETFRRELEEKERKERQRRVQEMVKMMEIRKEEEEKREVLQRKLDRVTKKLQERTEQTQKMRRDVEEKLQRDREENEKRERERALEQAEMERAVRRVEELKVELDEANQSLREQRRRTGDTLRYEAEEKQALVKEPRAARALAEALTQELRLRKRSEQRRAAEGGVKGRPGESPQGERERRGGDERPLSLSRRQEIGRSEGRSAAPRRTAPGALATAAGHAQEMGLAGLNAVRGAVGAPCCVQ